MSMKLHQIAEMKEMSQKEQIVMTELATAKKSNEGSGHMVASAVASADAALEAVEEAIRSAAYRKSHTQSWPEGLPMPNPELCKQSPPVDLVSSINGLKNQLDEMTTGMSAVLPGSLTQVLKNSAAKVKAIQSRLGHIDAPSRRDVGTALLVQPMLVRLEVLATLGSTTDVAAPQAQIQSLRSQLQDLCVAQTHQMDVNTAGTVGWSKIQLQTKLIDAMKQVIACIEATEAENAGLPDLTEQRLLAQQQLASLKEPRLRMKMQCDAAYADAKRTLQSMDAKEAQLRKTFDDAMNQSRAKVQAIGARQKEVWQQMKALYEELGGLALERSGEVQWQTEQFEAEYSRRADHDWGKQVGEEHLNRLKESLVNANGAIDCVLAVEDLLNDGIETCAAYQQVTTTDLSTQKHCLNVEIERELGILQAWTAEHKHFVHTLTGHNAAASSARSLSRTHPNARSPTAPHSPGGTPYPWAQLSLLEG